MLLLSIKVISSFKAIFNSYLEDPHSLAMGTFQHVQPNIQHPFGLNLEIPPLPKCNSLKFTNLINSIVEPGKPMTNAGIGVFSLNKNNNNNGPNIDMGTSLAFTLPQQDENLPSM